MTPKDFRHLERLRVRWVEVDMQKIVFNGHYLMYIDTAVASYWRMLAMPYHETMESLQGDLYVRKATLEYLGSARYDEQLQVGIRCSRIGNSSLLFNAAVFRGQKALVPGELVYVFADPATQTSRPVPQALREVLTAFEAGEPMVRTELGDWAGLGAEASALRETALVQELGLPPLLVQDAADQQAQLVVACNRFGLAVGTGRLICSGPAGQPPLGHVSRMATLQAVRGAGVGRAVLAALTEAARARGCMELRVQAAVSALDFYQDQGFQPLGPPYEEAGVAHQAMRRLL